MRFLALLPLFFLSVLAEKARFDNYRVYQVVPDNENQLEALVSLEDVGQVHDPVDVMVPPHKRDQFQEFLDTYKFRSNVKIENVQSLIDSETNKVGLRSNRMEWTNYHKLDEMYNWLDELAAQHPDKVKVVVGGKSYEGRPIKGIEITFGSNLTGVLLEAGIHAREWISPAGTSWMVNQMLNGKVDPVFKRFNYLYFPHLNPDGYVYSWEKNRLWRKTRTPYKLGKAVCFGADPNRNWDFHWNEIGSSDNPCSETYAGPKAFSEVESKTFSDYLKTVAEEKNLKVFVAYHSYSQLLLYPWGYTTKPSKDEALFNRVAKKAVDSLEAVHGKKFKYGNIATTIYPTSGTTLEWYYNEFNATLSYVYEMRDTGKHGFLIKKMDNLYN
ncbi:zinc carboxypeptidase, putative [Pediculus humanus corporis]|uniref:Zinc carboxypeptidase, putative n=1 Tax=Pediculus humanus subsp. corporis TaxID=121224 RepID=E0W0X1_PEDHC|nr:zinc carboxypeptidase, putative [Pediculus humanus corporis]EEB19277.1 zinc carboxypeptidase, putative [Pediculus humanus corporis]